MEVEIASSSVDPGIRCWDLGSGAEQLRYWFCASSPHGLVSVPHRFLASSNASARVDTCCSETFLPDDCKSSSWNFYVDFGVSNISLVQVQGGLGEVLLSSSSQTI